MIRKPQRALNSQVNWLEERAPKAAEAIRVSAARRLLVWTRHVGWDSGDVVLASFPRSGNTWTRGMLADLLTGGPHDRTAIEGVLPAVGFHRHVPPLLPNGRRLIKTHEPCRREYQRAIYLVRDIREVALSYFAADRAHGRDRPTFTSFVDALERGRIDGVGSWQNHVSSWLDACDEGRDILFVRYEDVVADTSGALMRIASFLGVSPTHEEIDRVERQGKPENVKLKDPLAPQILGRRFTTATELDEQSDEVQDALDRLVAASPVRARLGYDLSDDDDAAGATGDAPEQHGAPLYAPMPKS